MADDPLKALAEKGRDALSRDDETRAKEQRERESEREKLRDATLHASLGTGVWGLVFAAPIWVPSTMIGAILGSGDSVLLGIGVFVVGGLVGGFVYGWVKHAALDASRRWLAQLPFELDRDDYLSQLSQPMGSASVTVWVTFEGPLADADRATVQQAVVGAGALRAEFEGDRLRVVSNTYTSSFRSRNADETHYSHAKGHAWFKRLADEALRVIHARHPIATVEIVIGH
jgi:hypothetical protein